ncbi:MAG: flagella basal body P-ring formation protein FlgA [Proteobacteria bacterium]|nr:flagella basal body P-ring formation protein FlgA [Pseudomonadota bacterium]NDC25131.1 flagella basal body P-ring formation protein FlgA [Pseudomonadota bacterium]NDD05283.1 flagella basal body P-ring formation protein FlgA [Pseudomonadota bacterium]NDG27771.1 flagella basal body P-ring formation protein FlgA [Pseudomonadota bacterium]
MNIILSLLVVLGSLAQGAYLKTSPPSPEHLQRLLKDACSREWPEARIEVTSVSTQDAAPKNAMIIQLNPTPPMGAVSFELAWNENGVGHRTLGNGVIKVFRPVAIASKNISHGEMFSDDNIQFEEREINRFTQTGFFTDWSDLKGKVARGFVRQDSLIGLINSEKPVEILQGQMVELRHASPQMVISARMKALENGRMGSWIRVENPASKKVVRARVTAPGQVELR